MTDAPTETGPESGLDAAARRLTNAVEGLERRLGLGPDATGDLFLSSAFDADRQRLAGELDEAQARVRELEAAAADAAQAVDAALGQIRSALAEAAANTQTADAAEAA